MSFLVVRWYQVSKFLFLTIASFLNPQVNEHVEFANVMEEIMSTGKVFGVFIGADVRKLRLEGQGLVVFGPAANGEETAVGRVVTRDWQQ